MAPRARPEPSTGDNAQAPKQDPEPVDFKGINLPDEYHLSVAEEPVKPSNADNSSDVDFSYQDNNYSDDQVDTQTGKLVLLDAGQQGTLDTCRSDTRFTETILTKRLSKGSQMCLTTSYGHVALITFRGYAPESSPSKYMTVDVRVWRNAVEPEENS